MKILIDELRVRNLLNRFEQLKVLVVGDVGMDRYTIGDVERISPEAPVPILRVRAEKLKLGLAANCADNIATLKADTALVGVVGADRGSDDFRNLLGRARVLDSHLVVDPNRRTIVKERLVSDRQQLLRVDYETDGMLSKAVEAKLRKSFELALEGVHAVILQDYAKGLFSQEFSKFIFLKSRQKKIPVHVDPNSKSDLSLYKGASLLTPNLKEAEALTGVSIREDRSLFQACDILLKKTGAKRSIITLGKDGMAIFSKKGSAKLQLTKIPTYARDVYDVSGAGDTVISVLTLALAAGASLTEAAVLANLAAGVVVAKRGTATVEPQEILRDLQVLKSSY